MTTTWAEEATLRRIENLLEQMRPQIPTTPHGCICPPGAEGTCGGIACPRRSPSNFLYGQR